MGKKRIIKKSEQELLEEREKIEAAVKKDIKTKASGRVREGRIYIFSSYNNTIISLTDPQGNVLIQKGAGGIGFKGTKKGTPFAAAKVAEFISEAAKKIGINRAEVFVKGVGAGRDSALRSLAARGIDFLRIKDVTPIPHDGCRPPRPRRV